MKIEERLKALPQFVHLDEEDYTCRHCGGVLTQGQKNQTCVDELFWLSDKWVFRWKSLHGGNAVSILKYQWEDENLEQLLDKVERWIDENQATIKPVYYK